MIDRDIVIMFTASCLFGAGTFLFLAIKFLVGRLVGWGLVDKGLRRK